MKPIPLRPRLSEEKKEKIVRLYERGEFSFQEIATSVGGVGRCAVYNFLRRSGRVLVGNNSAQSSMRDAWGEYRKAHKAELGEDVGFWKTVESYWTLRECRWCGIIFNSPGGSSVCSEKCEAKIWRSSNREKLKTIYANKYKTVIAPARAAAVKLERTNKFLRTKPKCAECGGDIPLIKFIRSSRQILFCSKLCQERNRRKRPEYIKIKLRLRKEYVESGKSAASKRLYYKTNPRARIAKNLRNRLRQMILKHGGVKAGSFWNLVGTDWLTFKAWIESRFDSAMTWDNYGKYWHVDHIISCASFDLSDPEQQRKCFHYTNLQPMEGGENIRKGDGCYSIVPQH